MQEHQYVEMICRLADQPKLENTILKGFEVKSLKSASEVGLYECYYAAFQAGDAQFFFDQSEMERREFFGTLCLEDAKEEHASVLIAKSEIIVGFTYAIPYGDSNLHISCMVVHPDYQYQGLGKFMVRYAIEKAAAQGCRSITLGTDTNMGAFQLYHKHGFIVKE